MYVRDLEGNEYACQVTITQPQELNGNRTLTATILPSKVNKLFIDDIAEMWEIVDHDDVVHKIVYAKRSAIGDLPTVEITAVPIFFDKFDTERIYEEYNEHMTANRCFSIIFEDSGFNFVLVDSFSAVRWEGLGGGETRLEMFKRGLNRYKAEFRIVGNTVYLEKLIGRDTQFMYRYRLNASNIVQETDATAFYTYAKGYGDYEDGEDGGWESAKLVREYTSPLAQIPQIGIRHAPPIKNGKITTEEAMDEQLKTLVDESIKISVSATIHDLRKQGYELAQPELGDRVFLIDERIGLNEEVRVVDMTVTKNWKGEVIDLQLTFGSEGITKRYQSKMQTAINNIDGIISGNIKLPYSVLDDAVLRATEALRSAQTELVFNDNGILAIDKNDPNMVTLFNSAGLGVSRDGGATFENAITGDGINTNLLTAGSINTDQIVIQGGDASSYTLIQGDTIEARGQYTRTWFGETETHDVRLRFAGGLLRAESMTDDRRLYFSEKGLSTYYQGSNEDDDGIAGSGVLEFFSHLYHPDVRGVTLYSNRGIVALKAATRDVVLDAERYVRIYNDYSFQSNSVRTPPDQDNFYVGVSGENDGEMRVTNKLFWQGSHADTRYMNIRANGLHGRFLVAPSGGDYFVYLGSDTGVRVTSRGVYNNDPIVYRPIQASDFQERSSRKSKKNIKKYNKSGLQVINKLEVVEYQLRDNNQDRIGFLAEESNDISTDDGEYISYSSLLANLTKSVQELSDELEDLKNGRSA